MIDLLSLPFSIVERIFVLAENPELAVLSKRYYLYFSLPSKFTKKWYIVHKYKGNRKEGLKKMVLNRNATAEFIEYFLEEGLNWKNSAIASHNRREFLDKTISKITEEGCELEANDLLKGIGCNGARKAYPKLKLPLWLFEPITEYLEKTKYTALHRKKWQAEVYYSLLNGTIVDTNGIHNESRKLNRTAQKSEHKSSEALYYGQVDPLLVRKETVVRFGHKRKGYVEQNFSEVTNGKGSSELDEAILFSKTDKTIKSKSQKRGRAGEAKLDSRDDLFRSQLRGSTNVSSKISIPDKDSNLFLVIEGNEGYIHYFGGDVQENHSVAKRDNLNIYNCDVCYKHAQACSNTISPEQKSYQVVKRHLLLAKLLQLGFNPNSHKGLPLIKSVMNGDYVSTLLLLYYNADVNVNDCLPSLLAAKNGHYKIMTLLINHGAKLDSRILRIACLNKQYNIVKLLLESKVVPDNDTLLMLSQ